MNMDTKIYTEPTLDQYLPKEGELTVLSFGAGQDSTTILYKLIHDNNFRKEYAPNRLIVVFSDTRNEHRETYAHLHTMKSLCKQHGIPFYWLASTTELNYHSKSWSGLTEFYERTRTCGSKAFRKSCTDNLKIKPIYRFIESYLGHQYGVKVGRKRGFYEFREMHGKVTVLVGIAGGEEKRIAKMEKRPKWMRDNVQIRYPLIDLRMNRQACQAYIVSQGYPVPLPSNCMLCPYTREIELLWLYRFERAHYEKWVRIEAAKLERFKELGERNYGVWAGKTLPEVLATTQGKYGDWTDDQLYDYKMNHGHCVASKY